MTVTPEYEILGADGKTYPADLTTVRQWIADGRIVRSSQVYDIAASAWKPAGDIPALFPPAPPVIQQQGISCGLVIAFGLIGVAIELFDIPIVGWFFIAAAVALGVMWVVKNADRKIE